MKKVRIVLTTLVFALAITGAVVAKTNEKKRFASTVAYFKNTSNVWTTVTVTTSQFDAKATGNTQAAIIDKNNASVLLYIDQDVSDPAQFTKP